eukprot:gene5200-8806_t
MEGEDGVIRKKKQTNIKWKECVGQARYGFYIGFLTAASLAGGGGLIISMTPSMSGKRGYFLTRELPLLVGKGGMGFGSLLFIGGFLRCL